MLVGATWVVVEMVNTAAAVAHNGVLRFKEDIIDYMSNPNFGEIYTATHRWQVVKLNSSRESKDRSRIRTSISNRWAIRSAQTPFSSPMISQT